MRVINVKKLISMVIILCMISSYPILAEDAWEYAEIFYDNIGTNVNIEIYAFGDPAEPVFVQKEGIRCVQLSRGSSNYARFAVRDSFADDSKPVPSKVTVRYFDEGNGFLTLRYSNKTNNYANPERVFMTDSKQWKEYSFYLDDIIYKGAVNGYDLEAAGWTEEFKTTTHPLYIRSVKIEKVNPMQPIETKVTSDYDGNIFTADDDKILNIEMKNWYEKPVLATLYYTICDGDKNVLSEERSKTFKFEPGESKSEAIVVDAPKYDTYFLKIRWENMYGDNEDKTESDADYYEFSVANQFTKGDKENQFLGTIVHSGKPHYLDNVWQIAEIMNMSGFGAMREEIRWEEVEPEKGAAFNFDNHKWIDTIGKEHELLLILGFGHPKYDGNAFPTDEYPETKARFLEYVDAVTKRFKGKVKYYEFWNEPNLSVFNKNATPAQYAATLKEVYKIVKKNDSEAQVVAFSTAQPSVSWVRQVLEAGAVGYFDAVSTHPYDWDMYFDAKTYFEKMQGFKNLMKEYGIGDIPVLLTEMGISTTKTDDLTERRQAAELVQSIELSRAEGIADRYYHYNFVNKGSRHAASERGWGVLKNATEEKVPLAAKRAYLSVTGYNKFLGNAELQDKINHDDKTFIYKYKRNSDGKDVLIFWTEFGSETIGLNLGTEVCELYDMSTNKIADLYATDGVFTITTSYEPTYLIGNFPQFEETEPEIKTNGGRFSAINNDKISIFYEDIKCRNLKIGTEHTGNLTEREKKDVVSGKGNLVFETNDVMGLEEVVRVSLYDKEKCVYSGLYHVVKSDDAIETSAKYDRFSEQIDDRYIANLTVTNKTQGIVLSGDVNAIIKGHKDAKKQNRTIINLKPGMSLSVPVNLPQSASKYLMEMEVECNFDGIEQVKQTLLIKPEINCLYAKKSPEIMGEYNRDEWLGGDWFLAADSYAAKYYTDWEGAKDASFTGTIKWDENYMYFLAEVTDDVFYQIYDGSGSWQGDGFQIGVKNEVESGMYGTDFTEMSVYYSPEGFCKSWIWSAQFTSMDAICYADFDMSMQNIDGKYIYRAAIPWNTIVGTEQQISPEDVIRMSVVYNENDGQGRNWIEFNDGVAYSKNPELFGKFKLVKN